MSSGSLEISIVRLLFKIPKKTFKVIKSDGNHKTNEICSMITTQ